MRLSILSAESRRAIDETVDASLARIRRRAGRGGPAAARLAAALTRATGGGKRFRPALVVGSYEAFGGADADAAVPAVAAAFELLHTAFIVHDDVIDRDTMRRGVLNVVGEFAAHARGAGADERGARLLGDAAGILAGDLLLHEAVRMIALAEVDAATRARLFDILDDAVQLSAAGELADVENAVIPDAADPAQILAATRDKTAAYSFAGPLQAGAALAGARPGEIAAIGRCGQELGLAFQLVDDLIGAFAASELAGRESGADLREQKQTALIALARESDEWSRTATALALAPTGPIAVLTAQRALADTGAPARIAAMVDTATDAAARVAREAELPRAATALVDEVAHAIRERMPS